MSSISAKAGAIVDLAALLLRWPLSLGQKVMSASLPVTIASDQSGTSEVASPFFAMASVDAAAKNSPGNLMAVRVINKSNALVYLQVHNTSTSIAGGATPLYSAVVAAGSATVPGELKLGVADFGEGGLACDTGIHIGVSTAAATYTAATGSNHDVSGVRI